MEAEQILKSDGFFKDECAARKQVGCRPHVLEHECAVLNPGGVTIRQSAPR